MKMEDIILLGMGGHAHSIVDSIERKRKFHIAGFLDKKEMIGQRFRDYSVLDTDDALERYFCSGVKNAFVTIGFLGCGNVRNNLYKRLKSIGYTIPEIIDDSAIVAEDAEVQEGTFIGKKAIVNANARIGKMCIINTGTVIEHDCRVGDFSHVATGSVLCGNVTVGEQCLIGANATVVQGKKVGDRAVAGAGAVVVTDIPCKATAAGVPAKVIKYHR